MGCSTSSSTGALADDGRDVRRNSLILVGACLCRSSAATHSEQMRGAGRWAERAHLTTRGTPRSPTDSRTLRLRGSALKFAPGPG